MKSKKSPRAKQRVRFLEREMVGHRRDRLSPKDDLTVPRPVEGDSSPQSTCQVVGSFSYTGEEPFQTALHGRIGDKLGSPIEAEPAANVTEALEDRARAVIADGLSGYNHSTELARRPTLAEDFVSRHYRDTLSGGHDATGRTRTSRDD